MTYVSCSMNTAVHTERIVKMVAQSSEQAPLTSEIVGSILHTDSCMHDTYVKRGSHRSTEDRKFSPLVLRFPPTGGSLHYLRLIFIFGIFRTFVHTELSISSHEFWYY